MRSRNRVQRLSKRRVKVSKKNNRKKSFKRLLRGKKTKSKRTRSKNIKGGGGNGSERLKHYKATQEGNQKLEAHMSLQKECEAKNENKSSGCNTPNGIAEALCGNEDGCDFDKLLREKLAEINKKREEDVKRAIRAEVPVGREFNETDAAQIVKLISRGGASQPKEYKRTKIEEYSFKKILEILNFVDEYNKKANEYFSITKELETELEKSEREKHPLKIKNLQDDQTSLMFHISDENKPSIKNILNKLFESSDGYTVIDIGFPLENVVTSINLPQKEKEQISYKTDGSGNETYTVTLEFTIDELMNGFENKLYIKFTNKDENISVEEILVNTVGGDPNTEKKKKTLAKKN